MPTAEQCAKYQERYDEVDAALHQARLGGAVKRVRFEGKETEYTGGKLSDLETYFSWLADQLAQCNGRCAEPRTMITVVPLY